MQEFKEFSPESKIWVYQSNRKLNSEEIHSINQILADFAVSWKAHNHQLKAEAIVLNSYFIVFCVDENIEKASGCSIDKSFHIIRSLEKEFKITLFNRLLIAYEKENEIKVTHMNDFIDLVNTEQLSPETVIYNNSITHLKQLSTEWKQPAYSSWIAVHFNTKIIS